MSTSNGQIRVVIIDDHAAIREALAAAIRGAFGIVLVGEAGTAEEGLALVEEVSPDVAIVDISLQESHGLDLVHEMRGRFPHVQIVVFSMHDEQVYAERAVRAGALGYVMKSRPTPRVLEAIRRVHAGDLFIPDTVVLPAVHAGHGDRREALDFAIDNLTERETAVFELLGQGLSIEEIAEKLHMEARTADTHRRRIKEKLGLETILELMQFAIRWHSAQ